MSKINEVRNDLEYMKERANKRLLEQIKFLKRNLEEAERQIENKRTPNSCGIIQNTGTQIEVIVGEITALDNVCKALSVYEKEE